MKRLGLAALALLGCAGDPRGALDSYADALRARDAEQIWLLSDDAFRKAHDRAAIEQLLRDDPAQVDRLIQAIERADGVRATIDLGGGRTIVLVKQGGGWRVAYGGLEPFGADTPEAALSTFFRATEAKRLDALRAVMPEEYAARFSDDAALEAHLSSLAPRIAAARGALPALRPKTARIEGDRAWIRYAPGKKVTLIRQGDRWRVVDLE